MKSKLFIFTLLLSIISTSAQQKNNEDSLRAIINQRKGDTNEVNTLAYLAFQQAHLDSSLKYAQQGLLLAKKIKYRIGEADCFLIMANKSGDFAETRKYALSALNIYRELDNSQGIASAYLFLQSTYWSAGDYKNGLTYAFIGEKLSEENNVIGKFSFPGQRLAPLFLAEIGQIYVLKNQLDSALIYTKKSIALNELFNGAKWNFPIYLLATIQTLQGNYKLALENYRSAIPLAIQNALYRDTLQIFSGISTLFRKLDQLDSSIYYAQMVAHSMNPELETKSLLEAVDNLKWGFKLRGEKDSALKYMELSHNLKDSIFSNEKDRELQSITFNERLTQQKINIRAD